MLAEPLLSSVPTLHAIGNHEVEHDGINVLLTPQTETFSFPENYPFQVPPPPNTFEPVP